MKIMLVEDDKSLREIYSIRLVAEGYSIVSAGDGEEALAVAVKEKPDLILSDVMMPKISGFDMLDILRSTPETKDIKVIMMTALSSEDQRMRGESLGANMYLVKSQVGIEDVVNAVHTVLGDRPTPSAGAILATTASLATSQVSANSPQPTPMTPPPAPTPQYPTPSSPSSSPSAYSFSPAPASPTPNAGFPNVAVGNMPNQFNQSFAPNTPSIPSSSPATGVPNLPQYPNTFQPSPAIPQAPMTPPPAPTPQYPTPSPQVAPSTPPTSPTPPSASYLQDNSAPVLESPTPPATPPVGASALVQDTNDNEASLSSEPIAPKLAPIDNGNTEPVAHTMEEQMDKILKEAAAEERANEERLRQQAEANANASNGDSADVKNADNANNVNNTDNATASSDDNSANTDSK